MEGKYIIWKIIALHLLIYALIAVLHGCGMLKNTTKDKRREESEQRKSSQTEQLDLSRLYRETQIYSYRPDGSVAKLERRHEQVDATSISKTRSNEQLKQSKAELHKKSSPAKIWIFAGLGILMTLALFAWNKR